MSLGKEHSCRADKGVRGGCIGGWCAVQASARGMCEYAVGGMYNIITSMTTNK